MGLEFGGFIRNALLASLALRLQLFDFILLDPLQTVNDSKHHESQEQNNKVDVEVFANCLLHGQVMQFLCDVCQRRVTCEAEDAVVP